MNDTSRKGRIVRAPEGFLDERQIAAVQSQNRRVGPVRGTHIEDDSGKPKPAPAFREVAERYHGRPSIDAKLLARLQSGGAGEWGAVPMPPNPTLKEADARAILEWILGGAK